MSGKAILILALSFSTIFILFGNDFFNVAHKSTDDMVNNISEVKALEIARSATEVILSYFVEHPDSAKALQAQQTYFDNVDLDGGKVTSEITVDPTDPNIYIISTIGKYKDKEKSVKVYYGPQKLTRMASYCESSGNIYWTGNDVVKGAIYAKWGIKVYNHPTFESDVYSKSSDFSYFGRWSRHRKADHYPIVDPANLHFKTELRRPKGSDVRKKLRNIAKAGGLYVKGPWGHGRRKDTLFITLNGTNMKVRFTTQNNPWGANNVGGKIGTVEKNYDINSKVPNGLIYADNCVIRLKGKLDGQLTIYCSGSNRKGKGKILLDDDVYYKDNPKQGPSDDLLGIMADNQIEIADTPPNSNGIKIQAAIYSAWKGLTAENADTKPDAGMINFYGSLIEQRRMKVGRFDPATGELWGYGRKLEYDERLKTMSPPSFPQLQGFNILAWYEGDAPKH